jgi:2-polyprenyl-6-methoxyphenol hydroxylase-like FAD-dependent oxidoreductase
MKIVVVGAGMAGLVTALSLHAAGHRDVAVFERADEVRGLGVGLNLLPHAMRELTELGLGRVIRELGVEPATLSYYNRHGQLVWSEPRGTSAGYTWPQVSLHRGRLQLALLEAVRERLGDVVHTGHRLTGLRVQAAGAAARFETGAGPVDVEADLVIGADGIHSAMRRLQHPDDPPPVWGGLTLWRGTARVPGFLDGRTMVMAGDGAQKFVAYPLDAPAADGRQTINFIAEWRGGGFRDADWNRAVDPRPIIDLFTDWRFGWLDVPAVITAADELLEYPMVDRDALPWWSTPRSTLVGDAAHAMYPNGSNGASQAILDARVLAYHLATAPLAEEGLRRYEADRRPVTAALLQSTRRSGPERVMQLAQDRAPDGFVDVGDVIPAEELAEIAASYKRTAGFDPAQLAARASYSIAVQPGTEQQR